MRTESDKANNLNSRCRSRYMYLTGLWIGKPALLHVSIRYLLHYTNDSILARSYITKRLIVASMKVVRGRHLTAGAVRAAFLAC